MSAAPTHRHNASCPPVEHWKRCVDGSRHADVACAAFLLTASIGTLFLGHLRGSFGIPRFDDWSYINTAVDLQASGDLVLNGWVHMTFVVQAFAGAAAIDLFGSSLASLSVGVVSFGVVGLLMTYWIARRVVSSKSATLILVLTGLSPIWLSLSPTFMTDIPAWTLSAVSLGLGVQAILNERPTLLMFGAGVAVIGFGVREYAIVPFVALLVWVIWSPHPKKFRLWALGVGVVTIALAATVFLFRQSLPGSVVTAPSTLVDSLTLYTRLLLTLALLLAPYAALSAVFVWPRRRRLLRSAQSNWIGASAGMLVAFGVAIASSMQLAGNVIHPYGSSWTSMGDGVRSLPLWGFRAVTLVGLFSLAALLVLAGVLFQKRVFAGAWRVSERPPAPGYFAGLYAFISLAIMAVYFLAVLVAGAPTFDRYLVLVVPLLGIVIFWLATRSMERRLSKWQKRVVAGFLVVTAAFGIIITDGLNQVDGVRWQVASELVESGIPAHKIDSGDAWFRYHQKNAPGVAHEGSLENSIPGRTWWQTFFEGSSFCRMVAIESETDLQATYGPALSIKEERTILGTPFRVLVFPGPDPC